MPPHPPGETRSLFLTSSPAFIAGASAESIGEAKGVLSKHTLQPWRDHVPVSQSGGSYLNEAAVDEPNWKEDLYGEHYSRFVDIKKNMTHVEFLRDHSDRK
jgi:hypothetical protein